MRGIKLVGKICSRALLALLALVFLLNLYTIVMRQAFHVKQPTVLGYASAVVLSGSMEPAISVDDMVIVHRETDYQPGDIIMFESGSSFVTHRVAAVTETGYITRGDSNNTDDPEIPADRVCGKVVAVIPGVGGVIRLLQSPMGKCLLVLMAVVLLLPGFGGRPKEHA